MNFGLYFLNTSTDFVSFILPVILNESCRHP